MGSDVEFDFALVKSAGIYALPLARDTTSPVAPKSDEGSCGADESPSTRTNDAKHGQADKSSKSDKDASIDRPQCWGSIAPGAPEAYTLDAILGYRAEEFSDTQTLLKSSQVIQAVIGFGDPPTAQSQLTKQVDGWRQCGGAPVTLTAPGGRGYTLSLSAPTDAGNGITTMDLTPKGLKLRFVRAVAAKANVVIDLYAVQLGTTDASGPRQTAVAIGELQDPQYEPLLIELLDDPVARRAAVESLPRAVGRDIAQPADAAPLGITVALLLPEKPQQV